MVRSRSSVQIRFRAYQYGMKCCVYILKCSDGYFYTGITGNLIKRLQEHRGGLCPLTKNRGKIRLVYKEEYLNRIEANKREKEIKGWRRSKKENLIKIYTEKFTLRSD